MSLPTVTVTGTIYDQTGAPASGATVEVALSALDVYSAQYVFPTATTVTADVNGAVSFTLFPNALGENNTFYKVKAKDANGSLIFTSTMVVPNLNSTLDALLGSLPATVYNTGLQGVQTIPFLDQLGKYWSYLKNFNTASRNYTFPDVSGTVAVMSGGYVVDTSQLFSGYIEVMDKDGNLRKLMIAGSPIPANSILLDDGGGILLDDGSGVLVQD